MRKLLLMGGAGVLLAGAVAWTSWYSFRDAGEIQLPSHWQLSREPQYYRPDPDFPLEKDLATMQATESPKPSGSEESEAVEVIDLTQLQKTPAASVIEGDEPPLAELPSSFDVPVLAKKAAPTPEVADFLPHSADGFETLPYPREERRGRPFWDTVTDFLRGDWSQLAAGTPDEQRVVPYQIPDYHRQHPSCPYSGGCPYDGGQYRQSAKMPVKPNGSEAQDEPKAKPAKRDITDVRPGEIPWGWFTRPY